MPSIRSLSVSFSGYAIAIIKIFSTNPLAPDPIFQPIGYSSYSFSYCDYMGITVIDREGNTSAPFLRGILTRSLQNAGLSFNDAYKIANIVRSKLGQDAEITTKQLTKIVLEILKKERLRDAVIQYQRIPNQLHIGVIDRKGERIPFSKAHLAQSLEICAFPKEECFNITAAIEQQLIDIGTKHLSSLELARFTYKYLVENEPADMAKRYLAWHAFTRDLRPLVLLIGGTTGCGKSTVSSDIAHRLNIVRTQSTDMLREVMRLLIPKRLMPELHASSFNAWETLPSWDNNPIKFETHFIEGYLTQAREVGVGLEGVLKRAEREQLSLILEGVHIYPALQKQLVEQQNMIVVPIILTVDKRKQLKQQLEGRGRRVSARRAERYLDSFEEIWALQSFLLSEAKRLDITVIENVEVQETIQAVMTEIGDHLLKVYPIPAEKIFEEGN